MPKKKKKKEGKNLEIEEKTKKNVAKKYEKETKVSIIVMFVLIATVLFSHWVIQASQRFEYNGLKFYKEKEGDIQYYKSLLGFVTASGESVPFILKLRNDPRELDAIQIEGHILPSNTDIILSVSPEIANCSDTYVVSLDFSMTLKAFGKRVSAATTDWTYSRENDIPQATCSQAKDKTVIIMQEGNESEIIVDKSPYESIIITGGEQTKRTKYKDCYTIKIANCETQKGFERFILEMIENSLK